MLRDTMRQVYQELCRLRDLFVDIAGDASRGELEREDDLIAEME